MYSLSVLRNAFNVPRIIALHKCGNALCEIIGSRHQTTSSGNKLNMNKHLYSIPVNTCSEMYMSWYELGITRKKPLNGVDFDVVYYDNQPKAAINTPVIVALHGSGGSHLHFNALLPYLTETGARIIIPNFPGSGHTPRDKDHAFSHSDQERACFIADFLATLNVPKVDVLIVYSAGVYPGLYLMKNQEMFKSLFLLSPGGHRPSKVLRPLWLIQLIVSLMDYYLVRAFVFLVKPFYRRVVQGVRIENHVLEVAIRHALLVNFSHVEESLKEFALQHVPVILAYATNDVVVSKKTYREMTEFLQLTTDDIISYDASGKLVSNCELKPTTKWRPHCLEFEDGSHFIMNVYPHIIGKAIVELLERQNKKF